MWWGSSGRGGIQRETQEERLVVGSCSGGESRGVEKKKKEREKKKLR